MQILRNLGWNSASVRRNFARYPRKKFAAPNQHLEVLGGSVHQLTGTSTAPQKKDQNLLEECENSSESVENRDYLQFQVDENLKEHQIEPAQSDYAPGCILYTENSRKAINILMREGKKLKAQYIFHRALMEVKLRALGELKFNPNADVELDPFRIFDIAIENARPCMDLAKVGKRGLIYKVPSTISPKRSRFMAIRWMIESAYPTDSENTPFEIRLAKEIYNSFHLRGKTIKRRNELLQKIEENRAFVTYKWS